MQIELPPQSCALCQPLSQIEPRSCGNILPPRMPLYPKKRGISCPSVFSSVNPRVPEVFLSSMLLSHTNDVDMMIRFCLDCRTFVPSSEVRTKFLLIIFFGLGTHGCFIDKRMLCGRLCLHETRDHIFVKVVAVWWSRGGGHHAKVEWPRGQILPSPVTTSRTIWVC